MGGCIPSSKRFVPLGLFEYIDTTDDGKETTKFRLHADYTCTDFIEDFIASSQTYHSYKRQCVGKARWREDLQSNSIIVTGRFKVVEGPLKNDDGPRQYIFDKQKLTRIGK